MKYIRYVYRNSDLYTNTYQNNETLLGQIINCCMLSLNRTLHDPIYCVSRVPFQIAWRWRLVRTQFTTLWLFTTMCSKMCCKVVWPVTAVTAMSALESASSVFPFVYNQGVLSAHRNEQFLKLQRNGLAPVCILRCTFIFVVWWVVYWQCSHLRTSCIW